MRAVGEDQWYRRPYADAARVSWLLHVLDEVIHHGAEIALLRDLHLRRDANA